MSEVIILKDSTKVGTMEIDKFVVANETAAVIAKAVHLPEQVQVDAVDRMIARTPGYFELTAEEQHNKIHVALVQESVVGYLVETGQIDMTKKDVMYEIKIDAEGGIHIEVMYPNTPREVRRKMKAAVGKKQMERTESIMQMISADEDLMERAKKKLAERIKEAKPALKRIK